METDVLMDVYSEIEASMNRIFNLQNKIVDSRDITPDYELRHAQHMLEIHRLHLELIRDKLRIEELAKR